MKRAKIIAIAMTAALALTAFSGCVSRNDNVTAPAVPPAVNDETGTDLPLEDDFDNGFEDGIDDSIDDGLDRVESGIERGISEIEDGFDISRDEALRDESRPNVSEIEPRSGLDVTNESVAAAMSADFSEIGALSGEKDAGFPGGPVDSKNRPSGPMAYQQKYGKYGAYFIVPDSEKIYLTFDEGYEAGYTSKILDTLKAKNVKAVFFITYPYAKTETALVKRMIDEGHTLGNHSTKHLVFPDMPLEEAAKDLKVLHDYVLAQYGYEMTLFRPPEGAFSEQTLALAQSLNYNTMLWSFAYRDWELDNQPLAIEAVSNILQKAHPGEICLLHAVSRTNSEILGEVIDALRDKGFTFADYFYFQ